MSQGGGNNNVGSSHQQYRSMSPLSGLAVAAGSSSSSAMPMDISMSMLPIAENWCNTQVKVVK